MFVYILNLPIDVKINMEVDACAETGFHDIRSGIVYGKKRAAPQDGRNWRQENRNYCTKIVGHFKQKLIVYQYQEAKYKFFSPAMF